MQKAIINDKGFELSFTDEDVVDADRDFIPEGDYNPYNVRPWLLHDGGFTLAVVFTSCLSRALDIAADAGKLDRFLLTPEEMADYGEDHEQISFLGNNSKPYDVDNVMFVELPNPKFSFVALFNARQRIK